MKRVATIILNRNLPVPTNKLVEHLKNHDSDETDIFVVEAGSEKDNLSKYTTWYADWPEAMEHGLRYSRGMNYALSKLYEENKIFEYDAIFLLTNDTELEQTKTLLPLLEIMDQQDYIGILSPCSKRWGEKDLMDSEKTKYFWYIHNSAYLIKKEFIKCIFNSDNPNYMNFLFDGSNFRGYGSESELIAKAYVNDFAAAITTEVWAEENESHLINNADIIKTEPFSENMKLYMEEGKKWMRSKYGFNSRWSMQQYVKSFYDVFFEFHPELNKYKI